MVINFKDFSNQELLFLKKLIEISKRIPIDADACIGEPDYRIVEPHDVDRFSFVWELSSEKQQVECVSNTIIVPLSNTHRNDTSILFYAYDILSTMADVMITKKSPILSRICKFIYGSGSSATDLACKGKKFFTNLADCYTVVNHAWDIVNGEFTCNQGLLSYNRIYRGEYAYGAEELFNIFPHGIEQ